MNTEICLMVTLGMFFPKVCSIGDSCVVPPLKCPNVNVTFWLYTRANQNSPHELIVSDTSTITSAPWVKDAQIKILIHGYTGHKNFSPNTEIRPAYMECCDYNIISLDYKKIALEQCYTQAVHNTELVGMCTAQLIDELVQTHGFQMSSFHVIGFSLGGHVAGYISNYLKYGKLERISGLDPAMPLFVTTEKKKKLDADDAYYVDILHTNALAKGKLEKSGHSDFFANGGVYQPGCKSTENRSASSCAHTRATEYYAESIVTRVGFHAIKCSSWITYMIGWCKMMKNEEVLFGEYISRTVSGTYFFSTNSEFPYARGPRNTEE